PSIFFHLSVAGSWGQLELPRSHSTGPHGSFCSGGHEDGLTVQTGPGRSQPIRVLSRLTIVMSDSSHYRASCPEYRPFDLLAVQPQTDKLFLSACMTYDVDIICISVSERLPFFYKRAPVYGALERGVVFEVSYAASIRDATRRRYTLSNAMFHSDVCKGKVCESSGSLSFNLHIRTQLFGLSDRDGRDAVTTNCRAALLHGGL
uniref:Uncharacterized protein n=1 Tax=Neogobius melanostomus TaxID=47308 RepID=A0A8C6TW96_9GOBI